MFIFLDPTQYESHEDENSKQPQENTRMAIEQVNKK